jgi:bacillopeptidase F
LIVAVIFLGIPSLIRMAIFLSNLRTSGQAIETKDTVPPAPPRIQALDEATNSAKLKVKGFSEPGATLKLKLNGKEEEVVVDNEGQFVFDDLALREGENKLIAVAVDAAGNESKTSDLVSLVYDKEPPELTITSPEDGQEFFDDEKEVLVAGETNTDARVNVNSFYAVVDTEGNFVKRLNLEEGENEIKITARDKAGNTTETTLSVRYTP